MPRTQSSVRQLLSDARRRLAAVSFDPSPREAALLLGWVLGWTEAQILARDDREVSEADAARFERLLGRRLRGEPVAYLLGQREFYGRDFQVDDRVLIPRPETEHLVEHALRLCRELPPEPRILDIGAGSGCIAVTLAAELPQARVTATDRSIPALAVSAINAQRHGVRDRVDLITTDLAAGVDLRRVDLVVSNPPYIAPAVRPDLSIEVTRFEPASALFAADEGLRIIQRLLELGARLRPGTPLLLEVGHDQADRIRQLTRRTTDGTDGSSASELEAIFPDYAGIPRIVLARSCGI